MEGWFNKSISVMQHKTESRTKNIWYLNRYKKSVWQNLTSFHEETN
jgi:hypothetical protein